MAHPAKYTIFDMDGETVREREVDAWSIWNEPGGGLYIHLNSPGTDGTLGAGITLTEAALARLGWVRG